VTRWAVFDLNGTLLDPAGVGAAALDRAILAAMTLNHVGEYRRFPELLQAGGGAVGVPMPAYPEAGRALEVLDGAGFALAVLTNSPTDVAEAGLRAAGLRDRFAHVVGTDQVGVFKPDARVYRHGLAAIGAEAADATMVAAHWWDLRGARAVGMRVAWVGRGEGTLNPLLGAPDAQGADLLQTAMMLAGRTTEETR
jgi:HAD superfamily hydrolase (TIGR01493 family)